MPSNGVACAACGALLVGALVVHVCLADMYGGERPRDTVIATSPHVHGTHDDRAAEGTVDHDLFSRRIVVTTSARAITADPGAWDVYFRQILGPDGRPDATLFFLA